MAFRLTKEGAKRVCTGSTADGAANIDTALFGTFFCLFTSWPGWSPDLTLADLVLANFDGYTGKGSTWSVTYVGTDGVPSAVSNLVNWVPTGANEPNNLIGVAVCSENNNGDLIGIDAFAVPFAMTDADNRLSYALEYGIDPGNTYGTGTVIV